MADRDAFLEDVRARLEQAQAIYKRFYDKHHREVTFAVGDWLWLLLRHRAPASLQVGTSGKLRPRFFGPYNVVAVVSPVAYKLEFPPRARLHDVFHVGLRKPFKGTPPDASSALPPVHHGVVVLEPESVARAGDARCSLPARALERGTADFVDLGGGFAARFPNFQLEDELLLEGGRDVMWSRHQYSRGHGRRRPATATRKWLRTLLGLDLVC
jgi:hypothetical protein